MLLYGSVLLMVSESAWEARKYGKSPCTWPKGLVISKSIKNFWGNCNCTRFMSSCSLVKMQALNTCSSCTLHKRERQALAFSKRPEQSEECKHYQTLTQDYAYSDTQLTHRSRQRCHWNCLTWTSAYAHGRPPSVRSRQGARS